MNTRRWLLGLLLLGVLLVPVAVRAQSSIIVDPFTTVQFEQVVVLNGAPAAVIVGYMESESRAYYTQHTFAEDGSLNEISEAVYYDGAFYTRENDAVQWEEVSLPSRPTLLPPHAPQDGTGTLTELGSVTLDGSIRTTHYQFFGSPADGVTLKTDVFVGEDDERVHRWGRTASSEATTVEQVVRFFDFDNPTLIVAVPTDTIPSGNAAPPDVATLVGLPR